MHLKIERLFRDTIGSVTATSPKPAPSAPDPVVDNISTSSIARIDAWTAGAPALLVGVCPIMGATTTTNKGHASEELAASVALLRRQRASVAGLLRAGSVLCSVALRLPWPCDGGYQGGIN